MVITTKLNFGLIRVGFEISLIERVTRKALI